MGLRNKLDNVIKEYIRKFEKKHELEFEYAVSDDLMTALCFEDYFFGINDIIHCEDAKQPKHLILEWHDESVKNEGLNINFQSWCMGLRFEQLKSTELWRV